MPGTAITITTINVPTFMDGLCQNIARHQHDDVFILVIGDKKTPSETRSYCNETARRYQVAIEYLDIEDQIRAFSGHQRLLDLFPYNTPDRVILGGMLCYRRGCDRLIAVDDDNYATDHDFVGHHAITGTETDLTLIENDLGWFNVHSALVEEHNIPFFPRGYPWQQRKPEANLKSLRRRRSKVIVNQGLVLEDPDIDALSRLFWPIRATGMKQDFDPQFGLAPGTWSPFNYQNTSLARHIIPLYYRPLSTLRNADIWTAYLINRIGQHFNEVITFGQPLVKQFRNQHNLWDDLNIELVNNRATDYLITLLREVELTKTHHFDVLMELITRCLVSLERLPAVPPAEKDMLRQFFVEYQRWCEIVGELV